MATNTAVSFNFAENATKFLFYFSPVLVAVLITMLSFIFQNYKGFIYLSFLIASILVRHGVCVLLDSVREDNKDGVYYSPYSNTTFSLFVFGFTVMYLFTPMMMVSQTMNFWLLSLLLIYWISNAIYIKLNTTTVEPMAMMLDSMFGMLLAVFITVCMITGGSGKYLFFTETSSNNADVCYKPDKQTFKCSVYKNGELVGNV
jgi:hypothetical protein